MAKMFHEKMGKVRAFSKAGESRNIANTRQIAVLLASLPLEHSGSLNLSQSVTRKQATKRRIYWMNSLIKRFQAALLSQSPLARMSRFLP
jgi:hypothetical protein